MMDHPPGMGPCHRSASFYEDPRRALRDSRRPAGQNLASLFESVRHHRRRQGLGRIPRHLLRLMQSDNEHEQQEKAQGRATLPSLVRGLLKTEAVKPEPLCPWNTQMA